MHVRTPEFFKGNNMQEIANHGKVSYSKSTRVQAELSMVCFLQQYIHTIYEDCDNHSVLLFDASAIAKQTGVQGWNHCSAAEYLNVEENILWTPGRRSEHRDYR